LKNRPGAGRGGGAFTGDENRAPSEAFFRKHLVGAK
jgi:hypothetical protein